MPPAHPVSLQPDVLVLGGGLAGTAAATALARAGRRVTLVEREAGPKHKVCGEFLSAEALRLLAGLGVVPELHGAPAIGTVRLASGWRVRGVALPFPARSLTRRCLDELLLHGAAQAGVDVRRGRSVEGLAQGTDGTWNAALNGGEGVSAQAVILATGKYDLRGYSRPAGTQGDLVGLKMYFRLQPEQARQIAGTVELLLHPQGYTGLEPVEGDLANLTALVGRRHLAALGGWPGLLAELLRCNRHARQRLDGAEPMLDKPLAISSIPYGFVRRTAIAPGLYAVGDQAAVIPSFTGDGMSIALYTGLRAAQGLLRGEPSERFQRALHGQLRWQVGRATALSRGLVHPVAKHLLTAAAEVPGVLRLAASLTRLPESALRSVDA